MSTEESLDTWFSFTLPWDDSSKTAVDASDLLLTSNETTENMANLIDSRGFVKTDSNGHFIFGNTSQRVRFWGINLNFSAVYPPSPDHPATKGNEFPDDQIAEKLAARLAKLGFNAVRLHHLDNWNRPSGIWLEPWSNTQRLDPVQLARLDYLIYQLKQHGIYVDLNLHVSRNFVLGDGVTDGDLMKESNVSYNKSTTLFDPIAIGLQQQYAQTILTHINPYTGLAYADDPVIFTTETTNEDSFAWTFLYDNLNHDPNDSRKLPKFYSQQLDGWSELGGVDTSLNRLGNPGFENGVDDHWFTQTSSPAEADFVMDATNPYVGANALRIDVNQVTGTDWHVQFGQTNLALQAGKRYRLHFAVRADTARTISGAVMRHVTPYNSLGWSDSVDVTTAWQSHTIEFEATETRYGDARISFNVGAESGSIWFDDFQFQEIDPFTGWLGWLEQKYGSTAALATAWAPTGGLPGTEMLIDGGFESGFASWGTQASTGNEASWATDTNEMTEGAQSLQVDVTQADGSNWHIQFWQAGLSVIKDQAYRLTYDLKSNVDGQMSLNIMQHHNPWSQLGWATTVDVSTTWQQYEHIFTPNQDDTNARITLQVGHSGPRTLWMDNVSLKPVVPEGLLNGESLEANNVARLRYSDRAGYSDQRFRDTVQFYEETQRAYFQQMQTFIQNEVGSQSLNTGTATLGLPDVRAMADLDFVDTHYYWDHPWWPNGPAWEPTGWVIKNRSWLNSPFAGFFDMAAGAVQGKPFTVTEFNSASPNRYAVEAPLLMALMGNLQDWDGLFLFSYAHSQLGFDNDAISGYFDLAGNPVATGVMPVAARLFLGEQTSAAPTVSELHLTADERYDSMKRGGSIESFLKNDKALDPAVVFGGRVRIADLDAATPQTHNLPLPTGPVYQSAGNQLTWDTSTADQALFTFDAPQAQGVIGFMNDQRVNLTDIAFDIPAQTTDFGAITLQSQDNRTLATSRDMLLGVFTRAENTGMVWNAAQNSVDDQWGSAPTLIQPLAFDATLNVANSADVAVWALDETGAERTQIVHQIVGPSQISFTVDTATDETLWYRISQSPDLYPTLSVSRTAPIADTFVRDSDPDTNYGTRPSLEVDAVPQEITYLKFDLTPLAGRYLVSATLQLSITNGSGDTHEIKPVGDTSWDESSVTYNSRPANQSTVVSTFVGGSAGESVEVDLTDGLSNQLGQTVAFVIESAGSGDGLSFNSREATSDPVRLILTHASTPPVDLAIQKTTSKSVVAPGETISFTLSYTNNGPHSASGIQITDTIPAALTNVTVSSTGAAIVDRGATSDFVWDIADLASGQGGTIVIQGQIDPALTAHLSFTNSATISTISFETDSTNNRSQQTVVIWPETIVRYDDTSDHYANPERGFYKHTETHSASYTPLTSSGLQGYYADNHTLILRVFYLEDFVNSDISQDYLDKMQADFDTLRDAGLKAVARFAYTNVYTTTPPYGDATKAQVLSHIAQLAPLLQSNADVIATVQAGFIGTWGEWHYTDHFAADPTNPGDVTAADYGDRREIVDALLDVLPPTIQVQIRTPEDKQNMFGDGSTGAGAALSATEAHDGSHIARAAHHNDCFLASDTDYGTYGNINDDKAYLELETRYLVMGGETCNPNPPRSTCATALAELERFHWTYLNTAYHPDVLDSWVADGCMAEIEQRLGYRLALQQGLYSDAVRPGDGFTFYLAFQNLGFAAPIKARPVKLLLRHTTSSELYEVTLPADSRDWLPTGDVSHTLDHTVCTPADMPLGDYAMLLHLPDRAAALAAQPAYAIQLANNGVWESDTGYNNLLHTIRLDNSAPAEACGSSKLNLKKVVENSFVTPGWDDGVQWLKNQQVPNSIVPTPFSGREGAVISYRIPEDSPSYTNLYDRSWLYSNTLAVVTWALENECSHAQDTLAVLASLVEADGKLGFSFSTQSDFVHELYRSGAIAWAGYAFTLYQDQCLDSQFEATARSIADWLLTQQDGTGSVQGGPDVTWHSTEHNIDAYFFLRDLGLLTSNRSYKQAATEIKTSLLTNHWNDSYACFQQGIGDPEKALDTASWGAIFLESIGETEKASSCLAFLELNYPVTHTCTFQNEDRSVAGYLPYGDNAGINQVDLVWSEGTLGVALAYQRLGNMAQRDTILTNMLKMQGADGGIAYSCPPVPEKEWQDWESVAGTAWLTMVASENQAEFWRADPPTSTLFYISSSTGGWIQGVRFHDEDILAVDVDSGTIEKIFDGSDVGLRVDINAFHVMDDGTILMSFNRPATLNGLSVDDSDIVRFTPTKLGADTAGSFTLYFDGSDVGLTSRGEDIDAITLDADGRLIISTLGSFRRNPSDSGGTISGKDEDLFVFTHSSLGIDTAGTWSHYFDGSDLGLTMSSEDVWGVAIDPDNNDLVLTVKGAFAVTSGLTGDGADIFNCTPSQLGDTINCSFSMRWDSSEDGFGDEKIDSFSFSNGVPLSISAATRSESIGEDDTDDADELLDDDVADETFYMPIFDF